MENGESFSLAYVLITLLIRFVGVFVVLAIVMVAMMILGYIMPRVLDARERRRSDSRRETELDRVLQRAVDTQEEDLSLEREAPTSAADGEIAAAIGLALELELGARPVARLQLTNPQGADRSSPWMLQGRARQLRGWPR